MNPQGKLDPEDKLKQNAEAGKPAQPATPQPSSLEAEVEAAAAQDEPMGSIAAAVPGSDKAAQDVSKGGKASNGKLPGAEAPQVANATGTTAGTEFKREGEQPPRR